MDIVYMPARPASVERRAIAQTMPKLRYPISSIPSDYQQRPRRVSTPTLVYRDHASTPQSDRLTELWHDVATWPTPQFTISMSRQHGLHLSAGSKEMITSTSLSQTESVEPSRITFT